MQKIPKKFKSTISIFTILLISIVIKGGYRHEKVYCHLQQTEIRSPKLQSVNNLDGCCEEII